MIEELLPVGVRSHEVLGVPAPTLLRAQAQALFPEERALMAGRRPRRRRQFATARACARRCLADLGHPPVPLLPGPGGAPRWPGGVVGSITHCDGYTGAVAACTSSASALGIDAETALPLPPGVLGLVTSATEREELRALAELRPDVCWDRLLWCAKEAVYKAWYPDTGRWLGFRDATVRLDPEGTFGARLHPQGQGRVLGARTWYPGRWLAQEGLLLTAVAVPAHRDATTAAP